MNDILKTVTDEVYKEEQRHGNSEFPFGYYSENVFAFDLHCINWHWHDEIEIIYAEKGNIICYAGTEKFTLPQGCGLFLNGGVLHRYEATENISMPNIVFMPELLGAPFGRVFTKYVKPIIHSGLEYQIFQPDVKWQNEILRILKEIFLLQNANAPSEIRTVSGLLDLWTVLYNNLQGDSERVLPNKEIRHRTLLQLMLQYIHAHYGERISLNDISSAVYVSKNNALHIFKTGIRVSPFTYLIRYRLARAAELLSSTDKSVKRISDEVGFENPGYFCRKFKELYRFSPVKYRKYVAKTKAEG